MELDDEYCVIDTETSVNNTEIGNNKASAFWPENKIVATGTFSSKNNALGVFHTHDYEIEAFTEEEHPSLLIGQNFKFDLHHLRKLNNEGYNEWLKLGGTIWDTQIAEYLLSAQQHQFASLDELATKYGGTLKPDIIKTMWEAGVKTEDIDKDTLLDYLKGDVANTHLVASKQIQKIKDMGMMPLAKTQMDAALAIEEMEYNGMAIDVALLSGLEKSAIKRLANCKELFDDICNILHPEVPRNVWNIGSNQIVGALLFGGEISWSERAVVGKYKNGKDKYKLVEKTCLTAKLYEPKEEWKNKNGWSVSESVLDELMSASSMPHPILQIVKDYRRLNKELGTYIQGLQKLIYPDGLIHHNLNQTVTKTGRLSSSEPNGQNIPSNEESMIKKAFISRWGEDGVIIEADYKQLEVIALAFLTQDKQLIYDITHGVDMHFETGKDVFGWKVPADMDKDHRRIVKTINFGLIYGGGANTLAKQAGVDVKIAQYCINSFFLRYPEVKTYRTLVLKEALKHRVAGTHKTEKGIPAGTCYFTSITGRIYAFKEYDSPNWELSRHTLVSPTEIANYPVQGFATGDIVPMVMGELLRVLKNDSLLADKCLMINQVHDALLFDCKKEVVEDACTTIESVMESAPKMLKKIFGINFNLPLNVEVSYGPNWKE